MNTTRRSFFTALATALPTLPLIGKAPKRIDAREHFGYLSADDIRQIESTDSREVYAAECWLCADRASFFRHPQYFIPGHLRDCHEWDREARIEVFWKRAAAGRQHSRLCPLFLSGSRACPHCHCALTLREAIIIMHGSGVEQLAQIRLTDGTIAYMEAGKVNPLAVELLEHA